MMLSVSMSVLLALCLDKLLGEADRFHPLVGFGRLANMIEAKLNQGKQRKFKGILALIVCVLPFSLLGLLMSEWVHSDWLAELVLAGFIVYVCIGWRSLLEHARAVSLPLQQHDISQARHRVAYIVSRDCEQLNETDIAVAATESVLENGADAIFSAIFWFLIAGVPGVIAYRLVNTLDAMWGYKNERYRDFGWAAAKLDDALNYFPARLTALSYALSGHMLDALRCWLTQARFWKSPNAGPVMASGAGAIRVSLGGRAVYHGATHSRPLLGLRLSDSTRATANSIEKASQLVNRSLCLWVLVIVCIAVTLNTPTLHALFNSFSEPLAHGLMPCLAQSLAQWFT